MADLADRAQAREEEILALARARIAAAVAPGPSRMYCVGCADEIPAPRRLVVPGCTRCVHCEEDFERRKRKP